jgi:hypothetical protein
MEMSEYLLVIMETSLQLTSSINLIKISIRYGYSPLPKQLPAQLSHMVHFQKEQSWYHIFSSLFTLLLLFSQFSLHGYGLQDGFMRKVLRIIQEVV